MRAQAPSNPPPLMVIAGPCVIESEQLVFETARQLKHVADTRGVTLVFKASYDKANRTSFDAFRGPGLHDGLRILARLREEIGVKVTTDFHEPQDAAAVAEVVDVLQVPAFLSRQTDMLLAAAASGKAVNVKKGPFLAPGDMRGVIGKLEAGGASQIIITERGTTFGYNRLVVDFTGIREMRAFGFPVVLDATHAVQLPGGKGHESGGRRECVADLVRAGAAVGVDGLFLEVHPAPDEALSDGASSVALEDFGALLDQALNVRRALEATPESVTGVALARGSGVEAAARRRST